MDIAAFDPLNRLVGLSSTRRLMSLSLTPHTSYIYNNLRATEIQTFRLSKKAENELQNTGPRWSKTAPDVKKVCFFANLWIFCAQPRSKKRDFRENPVFVKKRQKNALFWRKNSKKTRKKREKNTKKVRNVKKSRSPTFNRKSWQILAKKREKNVKKTWKKCEIYAKKVRH